MTSKLSAVLSPRTIAVIGASKDPTKRGYQAIARLQLDGFDGRVYPVNPRESEILGLQAYASVGALPEDIDLALICTPASVLSKVLADCARKNAKGAIVLAAGFGETGEAGRLLERDAMDVAHASGIRVVGPNTNGVFNMHRKMNLVGVSDAEPGSIGIVSQSGNVMLGLVAEAKQKGTVGFSTYIGVGNQADLQFHEYLEHFGEDPDTAVPVFYVEGFKAARAFLDTAAQVTQRKPVVVYKSARTESGKRSAASHTGSLASGYGLTRDLLRQAGVTVVRDSDKILSVADALARLPLPKGTRVGILADSGGHGTIMADALDDAGVELAQLSPRTVAALRAVLPPAASIGNPVDVAGGTDSDPGVFAQCAKLMLDDEDVSVLIIAGMFGGYAARFSETFRDVEIQTSHAIASLARESGKPILVESVYAPLKPEPLMVLRDSQIPVFVWAETAATCVAELIRYAGARERLGHRVPESPKEPELDARNIITQARKDGRNALLETEARDLLRSCGIAIPAHLLLRTPNDSDTVLSAFGDAPLALKIVSRDVLHKSDAGGVALRVRGEAAVRAAHEAILARVLAHDRDARIEGVMAVPMAPSGIEVILGVVRDEVFGPVLMFGLGGIFVEVLRDVSFRAIPLSRDDAVEMIDQISGHAIFDGVRGMKAVDRRSLVDLMLSLSGLVQRHPDIQELDLNPVLLHETGLTVVDARVILTSESNHG